LRVRGREVRGERELATRAPAHKLRLRDPLLSEGVSRAFTHSRCVRGWRTRLFVSLVSQFSGGGMSACLRRSCRRTPRHAPAREARRPSLSQAWSSVPPKPCCPTLPT